MAAAALATLSALSVPAHGNTHPYILTESVNSYKACCGNTTNCDITSNTAADNFINTMLYYPFGTNPAGFQCWSFPRSAAVGSVTC